MSSLTPRHNTFLSLFVERGDVARSVLHRPARLVGSALVADARPLRLILSHNNLFMHQKYRSLGLCLAFAGALALGSCSKSYDDSALQGRISSVEGRVTQVENQLKTMNTNISSLQAMVEALKSNTPISAVTPVANNGYQLTFSGGKSITIYPDASGRVDSSRPTPRFKIENDYWFVSYDNAQSWERLSRAKGDQGERGVPGLQGERGIAGERGANGHTPVIGMERGSDGQYYWTVDGRRLQSSGGTAVTAVTTPRFKIENNRWHISYDNGSSWVDLGQAKGDTGSTPSFRIQNDYWEVSYNNGLSWTQLGRAREAVGTDASNGANSVGAVFRTVTEDNSAVHVTLASGDRLSIPKVGGISINFSQANNLVVAPSNTYRIGYTLSGQSIGAKASVEAIAQDGYRVRVEKTTEKTGHIIITTPSTIVPSRIILLISDGISQTITSALVLGGGSTSSLVGIDDAFSEDVGSTVLRVATSAITVPAAGGTVEIVVHTNTNYHASIPEEVKSWVELLPNEGRAVTRQEILRFKVKYNNIADVERFALVGFVDGNGVVQEKLIIHQKAPGIYRGTYHVIQSHTSSNTLEKLITSSYKTTLKYLKITGRLREEDYRFIKSMPNLKVLDISELSDTTLPAGAFADANIEKVYLPKGLTAIPMRLFASSKLTSIELPDGVQSIGEEAFAGTHALSGSMVMPHALKTIGSRAFEGSKFNGRLVLNEGLMSIGRYAFFRVNSMVGHIHIPHSVTAIGDSAFEGAGTTGDVVIGDGVVSIGSRAFLNFTSEGSLRMGTGLSRIEHEAFRDAKIAISGIGANVHFIGIAAFQGAKFRNNLIIPDGIMAISESSFKGVAISGGLLVIGAGVQRIGDRAFSEIKSLKKVWSKATELPILNNWVFYNTPTEYLGVPIGDKNRYSTDWGWTRAQFKTIEEIAF